MWVDRKLIRIRKDADDGRDVELCHGEKIVEPTDQFHVIALQTNFLFGFA